MYIGVAGRGVMWRGWGAHHERKTKEGESDGVRVGGVGELIDYVWPLIGSKFGKSS